MEIKLTNVLFCFRKQLPTIIMRTFIFLFCTTIFSFTSSDVFSQNEKIKIDVDKTLSIHEVFKLISDQTEYKFIYHEDLFENASPVQLKRGIIRVNKLLELSLSNDGFNFVFTNDGTIVLNKKIKDSAPFKVNGSVVDENGLLLPGVTIIEKGTKNGVSTKFDGSYNINVSSSNAILVFSFIGYTTQEVEVNGQTEINVKLSESTFLLEAVELISTGYQTIAREKLTGAAENINKSFYENSFNQTLQQGLQGSIAGLQIISNNTHPQAVPQVIIRGVGSAFGEGVGTISLSGTTTILGDPAILTAGSPLYIIDGVPTFDGRDLSSINGIDIKSITVLKDAAAASIYGARAANGVIVVETKSGMSGKTKINYSTQVGFSEFVSLNERLNTSQLQEMFIEGLINNTGNSIDTNADALDWLINSNPYTAFNPNQDTNWGKELTRVGMVTQHNLSASGGSNNNNYYLSLGYLKNESAIKEINFDRLTMKLKYDTQISKKLKASTIIGYGKTQSNNHETGTSYYNPFTSIYRVRPDLNIYNEDGSYDTSYNSKVNPLGVLTDETRQLETHDFRGVLNLNYELIPGLTLEASLSTNYRLTENYNKFPSHLGKGANYRIGWSVVPSSYGNQRNTGIFTWNARSLVRYTKKLGEDHTFGAFAGIEQNAVDMKGTNLSVLNLREGSETFDNGTSETSDTFRSESSISSTFLSLEYDFQEKYLVNTTFRRDGSSRFGANNKYGNFYAIGLGWNIHKEDFMQNNDFVNILKLRASYGVNGNDQISPFGYSGTFDTTGSYNGQNAATISSAGNALIGWEENATFDIGVDFALFNNRVSGFLDYYVRDTSDLLYNLPVSGLNGDSFVFQNFGGMKNSGVEISLNTKNIITTTDGFTWSSGITLTTNKNEITALESDEIISGNYLRKVGEDFNTLNLYGYAGVDPATGSELFYTDETESATTTSLGSAVKYNHGKATPDFYGSLINTVTFKNFSLTTQLYSSWGGQIFEPNGNVQNDNGYRRTRDYSNTSKYVYDNRWQQPGDITNVPKYVYGNSQSSNQTSRWLHDGSYVRLKRVELAYTFSNKMLQNSFIDRLRIYVSGDNLWTSIKDNTLMNDPEMAGITGSASFNNPISKTISFGLNVTF